MPIQHQHYVSSQKSKNPHPPIRRNTISQNEPNFIPRTAPNPQNEPNLLPATIRKIRNEPNCHPRVASRAAGCGAKRSGPKSRDLFNQHRQRRFQTNKPPAPPQKMQNEPNLQPRGTPITQNEPNFSPFRAWHFEFRACFGFPPICRGVLCETNPISAPLPAYHAERSEVPMYIGEPNMPHQRWFSKLSPNPPRSYFSAWAPLC